MSETTGRFVESDDSNRERAKREYRNRVKYHPPATDSMRRNHERVNELLTDVGCDLIDICPASREMSLVLTNLEQARMWANAALAIHVNSQAE